MESVFYLFPGFRWQDALDILLNTYILFRMYVLFRGTNVFRGLVAITVLWGGGQAAHSLGLIVTNWAMQGVIAVAALIVIIVFRNEIAGVLQTKNLKSFLWGIPQYQFHTPLDIISQSVRELARKKIGALIVLPLKQGMDSVVQGGTPLEGKLSQQLLKNVFWPGSPMHDGAAIIQGDQIICAGAILPLSKNDDLPSFFGTRHRAAAGLTQSTDALVIVVSEERGEITVFKESSYHRVPDASALKKLLAAHAGDDSSPRRVMKQTVELALVALICLAGVTGLWASFSKGMETLAEHEVPIEFINPDQKMEIVSSSASSIKLLISGARPLIKSTNPEQIEVKLDLSGARVGDNTLDIAAKNILLPPGIRLKKITPPKLSVTLDALVEKELFVQPHWVGSLPDNLVMKQAQPLPEKIWVTGGGLALKGITTVFTEAIPLDQLIASGALSAKLVPDPPSLKFNNHSRVRIQYSIQEKKAAGQAP